MLGPRTITVYTLELCVYVFELLVPLEMETAIRGLHCFKDSLSKLGIRIVLLLKDFLG